MPPTYPTLLLLCLGIFSMWPNTSLSAQEVYAYSCQEGTYGVANVAGELLEDCIYKGYRPMANGTPYYAFQQQDGRYVAIAFSGEKCPYVFERRPSAQLIRYQDNRREELVDSIYAIYTGEQVVLHHPRQKGAYFLSLSREQAGFSERYDTDTYEPLSPNFYYGLSKIHPAPGQTNFIDHEGNLMLSKAIRNGKIVDDQRFAHLHDNGLFSLNDYNQKAYTDAVYHNILATVRPGYYIANMPDHFIPSKKYSAKAALLDATGKHLIDTVHHLLMPINEDFLVAGQRGAVGLIDYSGKVHVPLVYETIGPAVEGQLIAQRDGKYYLIDYAGQPVGDGLAYDDIICTNRQAYYAQQGQDAWLLDKTGQSIYQGQFRINSHIPSLDYFIIRKGNLQGIVTDEGEVLAPLKYAQIKITGANNVILYQDADTKLYGLWDSVGQEILPPQYADIHVRHRPRPNGLAYWAKPAEGPTYQGFDQSGKALDGLAILNPGRSHEKYFSMSQRNGSYTYTLPDGRKLENVPYKVDHSAKGPDGTLVHRVRQGQDYYLLDADFYNLIPEGFRMLRKYLDDRHLTYGLVPVYNDYESGVINLRGEWVVEPGPYGYSILSASFIRRHRGEPRGYSGPEGIDLLFVEDGAIAREEHYTYVYDEFLHGLLIVGKKNQQQGFQSVQQGLLDSLGKEVLPLQHYEIKIHKDRITTRRYLDAQSQEVAMYDLKGAAIFSRPGEKLVYYPEQGRCVLTQAKQTGLLTETGEVILPVQYDNLRLLHDLLEYKEGDEYVLADQDGVVYYRASSPFYFIRNWRDGYRQVFRTNTEVLLFDKQMDLIARYPYKAPSARAYVPHLLLCKSQDNRRTIYINLENGVAYGN